LPTDCVMLVEEDGAANSQLDSVRISPGHLHVRRFVIDAAFADR
jgi:hypothetical protein